MVGTAHRPELVLSARIGQLQILERGLLNDRFTLDASRSTQIARPASGC